MFCESFSNSFIVCRMLIFTFSDIILKHLITSFQSNFCSHTMRCFAKDKCLKKWNLYLNIHFASQFTHFFLLNIVLEICIIYIFSRMPILIFISFLCLLPHTFIEQDYSVLLLISIVFGYIELFCERMNIKESEFCIVFVHSFCVTNHTFSLVSMFDSQVGGFSWSWSSFSRDK